MANQSSSLGDKIKSNLPGRAVWRSTDWSEQFEPPHVSTGAAHTASAEKGLKTLCAFVSVMPQLSLEVAQCQIQGGADFLRATAVQIIISTAAG